KKLFDSWARALSQPQSQINKVFFASFLFTKKKSSLPSPSLHHPRISLTRGAKTPSIIENDARPTRRET
ncbi:hypothetical protein, partial [Acidiphilium sp.]|uniref:hypothetical protein n=1 Tax=Acidiphilium sp. TaxID=527 RepID=UPI00258A4DC6